MKKVGIITLNGYFNYGNRLQNYALQEILKDLGFEVETIINKTKSKKQTKSKIKVIKEKNVKEIFVIVNKKIKNYLYKDKLDKQRTQIFKDFSLSYISETDFSISEDNIPDDI